MGTPLFATPVLETLLGVVDVVGVYTVPDRRAGRGRREKYGPVKEYSLAKGLSLFQPASLRDPKVQQEFCSLNPDFVLVAAYGRIVPPELLAVPPQGFLNIHPSLLPKHRGPSPVVTAILDNSRTTGVSLIRLDEGVDSGEILAQRSTPILPDERAPELTCRLFQLGSALLAETLPGWLKGAVKPSKQDEGLATHTRKFVKEDGRVDWRSSSEDLYRRFRAFYPWPGLHSAWQGKSLRFIDVVPIAENGIGVSGTVLIVDRTEPTVAVVTGRGLLGIKELQLEGRRVMSGLEFVRGHPEFLGGRLPS